MNFFLDYSTLEVQYILLYHGSKSQAQSTQFLTRIQNGAIRNDTLFRDPKKFRKKYINLIKTILLSLATWISSKPLFNMYSIAYRRMLNL